MRPRHLCRGRRPRWSRSFRNLRRDSPYTRLRATVPRKQALHAGWICPEYLPGPERAMDSHEPPQGPSGKTVRGGAARTAKKMRVMMAMRINVEHGLVLGLAVVVLGLHSRPG